MANPVPSSGASRSEPPDPEASPFQRLKVVFSAVSDIVDPEELARRLGDLLPNDPTLREEAERLVCIHQAGLATGPPLPAREPTILKIGDVFADRFEIEKLRGRGGMGEVYEAYDRRLGQLVALKVLRPEFAVDSIRDEILNARRVGHPNVCQIGDLIDAGLVAFTMELLEGETLGERLERIRDQGAALAPKDALPLIRQMAAGLDAIHGEKIVHRDFKPDNVIIVRDSNGQERVKITDFGISRAVDRYSSQGPQGTAPAGTPRYMAPEQWTSNKPSAAIDIYALGVVIREMLTGDASIEGEHPKIRDGRWKAAITQCLQVDPTRRPASAGLVVEFIEGKQKPKLFKAIVALALLIIAAFVWYSFTRPPPLQSERLVVVLPITTVDMDDELKLVAEGLTETITLRLSQYEAPTGRLSVIPASEIRRLELDDAAEARIKLRANYAVLAVLQRQDYQIQLVISLIDTERMIQRATAVVEGSYANLLTLQDGAVTQLANILELRPIARLRPWARPPAPGVGEYYLQGVAYLQRSDKLENLNIAEELFNRALAIDETHADSHAGLAKTFWYRFRLTRDTAWVDPAKKAAGRALELDPDSIPALLTMARILNGTNKNKEAEEYANRVQKLDRNNPEMFEVYGLVYEALGEYDQAEETYKRAIEKQGSDWELHKRLGLLYLTQSRYDDAIESLSTVVRLSPDNVQGYSNLGVALYQAGRLEEATAQFEQALKRERRFSVLSNLGAILFDQRSYAEAARYFEEAVQQNPEAYLLWGNLGAAYEWAGDPRHRQAYRRALDCLEKERHINPQAQRYPTIALYEASLRNLDAARNALKQALKSKDHLSARDLARLAQVYEILGERKNAVELLQLAISRGIRRSELDTIPQLDDLLRTRPGLDSRKDHQPVKDSTNPTQ